MLPFTPFPAPLLSEYAALRVMLERYTRSSWMRNVRSACVSATGAASSCSKTEHENGRVGRCRPG